MAFRKHVQEVNKVVASYHGICKARARQISAMESKLTSNRLENLQQPITFGFLGPGFELDRACQRLTILEDPLGIGSRASLRAKTSISRWS